MEIFRREKGIPEPEETPEKQGGATSEKQAETTDEKQAEEKSERQAETKPEEQSEEQPEDASEESSEKQELPPYLRYQAPSDNADVGRFSNGKIDKDEL